MEGFQTENRKQYTFRKDKEHPEISLDDNNSILLFVPKDAFQQDTTVTCMI